MAKSRQLEKEGDVEIQEKASRFDYMLSFFTRSGNIIWKSRISWSITLTVFLTILTVEATLLNFNLKEFEAERLIEIENVSRAAIAPMLQTSGTEFLESPLTDKAASRIINKTIVNGMRIYSPQFDLISTYGEPMALLVLNEDSLSKTYRSADGSSYEFILRSNDLGRPYIIAVRADSGLLQDQMFTYIKETLLIMLLMSALVTTVLMIALGHWLLEPILFLRNDLLEASKNPENPNLPPSPFKSNDEIGNAIEIARKLILQNAENIKHVKTAAEDKIHRLAYYDPLTGLPNRASFLQKVANNMRENSEGGHSNFAIIAVDLDHFKDINDSMGHNVGDAIIRGVGKRMRSAMPEAALVSRTGEDEFAVMMPLAEGGNTARDIAERIHYVIRNEPFKVFNEEFQVRGSVGVVTFPKDGLTPDLLLKNADIALNRAKEEGRDAIKEYSEDFDRAVQARFQMLRDLRDAMEQDQLTLHYQPQLDLKSGKIIGAEALIRWWKPDNSKQGGSFISPGEFIPVAEQSGLIVPIGEMVIRRACQSAAEWNDKHGFDMRVAVNVSGAQFSQTNLVDCVSKILKETGLPAHKLELEVTESIFMDDIRHTIKTLKELHALGVELAIDDFGTGYSSLSYLRQFPIDRLKIDQSFIRNALNNIDDASITRTIITLGHSLHLKVIAEGVETKEHEDFLLQENCDEVQGFRYSKPIPHDDFVELAKKYNGDLSYFCE